MGKHKGAQYDSPRSTTTHGPGKPIARAISFATEYDEARTREHEKGCQAIRRRAKQRVSKGNLKYPPIGIAREYNDASVRKTKERCKAIGREAQQHMGKRNLRHL